MPSSSATEPTIKGVGTADNFEVDSRFAEIGLSPRTGWYASIALYAMSAAPAIVLSLIAPTEFPRAYMYLGLASLAMSVLSYVGLKLYPNSTRATHARLSVGLLLQTVGAFTLGDTRQIFALLPLTLLLPPAIYYGVREATAYLVAATAVVAVSLLLIGGPLAVGMATCAAIVLITVTGSMMIAQLRTRRLAVAHHHLACTDPLTNVSNTRRLHEQLNGGLSRASDSDQQFAMFAIDLDNFKLVNDEYGHSVGDAVLKAVARAIDSAAGPDDIVARRGGDEFSLFVPDPFDRDLDLLAAEIGDSIEGARREACPQITASASVAYVISRADDTVASILERGDNALHATKVAFHRNDPPRGLPRLAMLDGRLESERQGVEENADLEIAERRLVSIEQLRGGFMAKFRSKSPKVDRPLWLFAAIMPAILGSSIIGIAAFGLTPGFHPASASVFAAVLYSIALLSLAAAALPLARSLAHVAFTAALITMIVTIQQMGSSGVVMVDLLMIPTLFAFLFFDPKAALIYMAVAVAAHAYLGIAGSYPFAVPREVVFGLIAVSSAVLAAKVRSVTTRFIVQNWELSQRDGLTGLANMRALRSNLTDAVARSDAGDSSLALIAIDLDEFKKVNDEFSHSVGDQMIIAVARTIHDNVRADDVVARRGGDEFLVLTENLDDDAVAAVSGRIAEAISRTRKRLCPGLVSTASVEWSRHDSATLADDLIQKVDAALHQRKLAAQRSGSANNSEKAAA